MGSRDVEKLLGARLGDTGLDPERAIAFRGRFDRLRKLGCPSGVNTGKGRAASYGWTQIVQLALALDLINLGLTPEHAAAIATGNERWLGLACLRLTQLIGTPAAFKRAIDDEKWPLMKTIFLVIDVGALSGFKKGESTDSPSLGLQEGKTILEWLRSASAYEAANILIDLGTKTAQLMHLVALWSSKEIEGVITGFADWAEQHVNP
ncbi:MAG TPA: hypothetical protein VM308_02090 [Sphingomicrobium sp.]|nr:hypothetical protein [Sphingomicrobium sp.]